MGKIAGLLSGKIIVIPTKIVNAIFTCKKKKIKQNYSYNTKIRYGFKYLIMGS